jgi:D-aminopeptidase
MTRARLRDLGIVIGTYPTGTNNAITDVPGVLVGQCTLLYDEPRVARTGVTMVVPRAGKIWEDYACAGCFSFNGNGDMTGIPWLEESGMLTSAVGITNTHQVGVVRDALVAYATENGFSDRFMLPVVTETYDGWLNDINAFHVKKEHVYQALTDAASGAVAEGNVGGGTGMICHDFKGGIGTSSRLVDSESGQYTVGILVQSNYGDRQFLRVNGVPVGQEINQAHTPLPWISPSTQGSIIIVVATDAPLLPGQCTRMAKRATVGMARVGGVGYNGSGDLFLAFATGNHLPPDAHAPYHLTMIPHHHLNPFFEAVAEATEEAILNSLTAAETLTGYKGRTAHAVPLDELQHVMARFRPQSAAI